MDDFKKKSIERIVDASIYAFAEGLMTRYKEEVNDPQGVINAKKNNCFMAELGEEFMFYSAFVRSFDSSFGNVLEKMGNELAELSYTVHHNIESFMIPDQTQRIASIFALLRFAFSIARFRQFIASFTSGCTSSSKRSYSKVSRKTPRLS